MQKGQIILQGPPGTGKTYTAKDIAEQILFSKVSDDKKQQKTLLESTEQFKLIQFHPAYSYEDFVRGIVAESKGEAIEYKTKNKLLADFAAKALSNYIDSRKNIKQLTEENWIQDCFLEFSEFLTDEIEKNNGRLLLDGTTTYLKQVEEDCFRYMGDNWNIPFGNRMQFKDILEMFKQNVKERQDIKKMSGVSGLARQNHKAAQKISKRKKHLVLLDARGFMTGSDKAKAFCASQSPLTYRIAVAVLVDSLAVRLRCNAFIQFNKPKVPTRVFSEEQQAMDWLKEFAKE